jgi:acyl-coenzyme A synthetase/AMP-(fatty) acid ligase
MTDTGERLATASFVLGADRAPIVRTRIGMLTSADLLTHARALALRLPSGNAGLNLCNDRCNYLTALLAMASRRQVCLMPPSRASAVLDEVAAEHPDSFRVTDELVAECKVGTPQGYVAPQIIDAERIVAVGYTSGTTGRPQQYPKSWRSFAVPASLNERALRSAMPGSEPRRPWIVATVPSQHMYGMECAAMLPLFAGMGVHAAHPLFPADIAAALGEVPSPRILVSTPIHLRVLLEAKVPLPRIEVVVSATAPLSMELAAEIEARFATRVLEFFGSTETCVIASRRTAQEKSWRPYPGLRFTGAGVGTRVEARWFDAPVTMQDAFEFDAEGRFEVVGRNADMIEIAGKRASLESLTRRLLAVPGVQDAAIMQPPPTPGAPVGRLVALVVIRDTSPRAIAEALAAELDPAFMPRPIVAVSRLPRNDVGKLPREALLQLVRELAPDGSG